MQCDFLDYTGGILCGGYYCKKDEKYLDKRTVNTYCDNSLKYRDCPIYNQNSSVGCYLTTAMCDILGFNDDCNVLETLRGFRDNYMKNNKDCTSLLEDYDNVGPMIVKCLNNDSYNLETAKTMLDCYIAPAIEYISIGDFDAAIDVYKNMTLGLMKRYELDTSILSYINEEKPSKVRQRKIEY